MDLQEQWGDKMSPVIITCSCCGKPIVGKLTNGMLRIPKCPCQEDIDLSSIENDPDFLNNPRLQELFNIFKIKK